MRLSKLTCVVVAMSIDMITLPVCDFVLLLTKMQAT